MFFSAACASVLLLILQEESDSVFSILFILYSLIYLQKINILRVWDKEYLRQVSFKWWLSISDNLILPVTVKIDAHCKYFLFSTRSQQ